MIETSIYRHTIETWCPKRCETFTIHDWGYVPVNKVQMRCRECETVTKFQPNVKTSRIFMLISQAGYLGSLEVE